MSRDPRVAAYSVMRAIGKGSYGEVFLVTHCKEKKQYVMKNMKLTAASSKERSAAEQEASLLSKLHHPNIVAYKESFQDEHGVLHIVMSYCEGGDLCTRLKASKGRLLPEPQVVEWFVQITLALQYLHNHKILHRDLKTQNIFLSKNNIIKVGDLGIARVLDGSCDLANTVIGTPYYMSPELFANKPYNYKSDIWALGCCVYEIATLKHAFTATNINALMCRILQGKVPPLPSCFSEELGVLVQKMLALNAKDRPSVNEILRTELIRRHIRSFLEGVAQKKKAECDSKKVREGGGRRSSGDPPPEVPRGAGELPSSRPPRPAAGDYTPLLKRPSAESITDLPKSSGESPAEQRRLSRDSPNTRPQQQQGLPPSQARSGRGGSQLSAAKRSSSDCSINVSRNSPLAGSHDDHKGQRHSSLSGMQADGSPKEAKPPLPLPPDPALVATPPSSEISSARQRRRISKQGVGPGVVGQQRARIVLKPKGGGAGRGGGGSGQPQPSEATDGGDDVGQDVGGRGEDCAVAPSRHHHQQPGPEISNGPASRNDPAPPKSATKDGDGNAPMGPCSPDDEGIPLVPSSSSSALGQEEGMCEVDEFFSLLDTTLHLPEAQPEPLMDAPPPKVAFTNGGGSRTSGRLGDRVIALRQECLHGLGADLLSKAHKLLDAVDPEIAEEAMKELLGKDLFECFAAKLQELKLCEDSLHDL